jgi:uncharacterized membrane protein YkvA (DUF1232 family)
MFRGLLIAVGVFLAIWLLALVILLVLGKRSQARELAKVVPNLLFLFRGLLKDPRVPKGSKALVWFAVAWLVSPIDLIPEFIPVVGPLDDVIVAALVLRHVVRHTERSVVLDHWRGKASTLEPFLLGSS